MTQEMSEIETAVDCLKRHDPHHREYYDRNRENIIQKIQRLGDVTRIECPENATTHRGRKADLFIATSTRRYVIEVKLCLSTSASLGRHLLRKAKDTLSLFNEQDAALLVAVDSSKVDDACEKLKTRLRRMFTKGFRIDVGDVICTPSTLVEGMPYISIRFKRASEALKVLKQFGVTEIGILPL